jgi:phosphoglycolate phosphatase
MKFDSVLFDLDGTLLNTADDLGAALNYVLRQQGLPEVTQQQYTPEASNGSKGLLQLGLGDNFENYDFEALKEQLLSYYAENIAIHTDYFDEVVKTLTFLDNNNIAWGIVTNKPAFLTTPLLEYFPLLKNCRVVVSGDTVGIAKPHPKPMLHALEKINGQAHSCLYVGDAQRDIEAGKRAGMKTVAALYGYIDEADDSTRWAADYSIDCISKLIPILQKH